MAAPRLATLTNQSAPSISHIYRPSCAFSTTPSTRSSLATRLQLRTRSFNFTPIDPDAITIPAALLDRINNGSTDEADNDDDDDDSTTATGADDDPTTLIDHSTAARRTLFRTLRQLQRMPATSLSLEYVSAIVQSLTRYTPLLPREQLHIAVLYAHVGRETESVVWVAGLVRDGLMTAEWAELVRSSAEGAGLVGLEERMNRIVKTLKAVSNDSGSAITATAPLAGLDETTATVKA